MPFCRPTTSPTTRAQAATRPSWSPFHQVLYPIRKDVGTVMGTVISRLSTSTSGCQLRQAAVDFDKRLSTSTSPRDLRFVDCQGQVRGPAFVEEFKMRVNAWIRVARCHDSCRSRRRQVVVGVVDRLLIESKAACPQPARPFVTQRFLTQREFHWSVAIANHQRYETEGYPILACPCPQILYVTFCEQGEQRPVSRFVSRHTVVTKPLIITLSRP